ncbi:hypothetical protein B0T18DRAFT_219806 [Schizothecium vesticola]|uniref:Uncharacterized protein n=1 Tax=Schizothecium vesticola TaxID=314040 RepID=A0AA40EKB5_9PEZI|nr:hypothetical protein B0T18DRAFT_219806 [Schizothecium vesticola]
MAKVREVWRDAAVEEDDGRDAAVEEDDRREDEVPPKYAWSIYEMTSLMDVGLRKLLGVGKGPQGFRTSKSGPSPSLMDIAPGVWNLRYLQSLETHARAIPAIASGIARLTNARSSRLREKVARLGFFGRQASNTIDQVHCGERVEEEIRGRLWSLCQTRIQAGPMAKAANHTRAAAVKEESTYEGGHLPLVRYGENTNDVGGSQEYLDDHDSQVALLEASSGIPRQLQIDLQKGIESEFVYDQHIYPGMFCDIPEHILGNDEIDSLFDYPPWTAFNTSHSNPWAGREPLDHLLDGLLGINALVHHISDGGLLGGGSEDFELSQEDDLLTTADDHPFAMTSTNDHFQDDSFQYDHALEFLEDDVADDEDIEEEDEGSIYTDGQGNSYTFEPHDAIPREAGFPENVDHLASLQQAPTEEERRRWFHRC